MKVFGTILLIWVSTMVAYGQLSMVRFSVALDPQFAWLNSDEDSPEPDGSILHIHPRLQMDYFFSRNYAFVVGIGLNNLGGKLDYADSTEFSSNGDILLVEPGQEVKLNTQYVDIPLGLKLKTEELGYMTFFLQLGLNPMINTNAKLTDDLNFDKEDVKESIHAFNLGYHAGLGVEYRLGGNTAALAGIRWNAGFTDISNNDQANLKTQAISIHLGILF